MRTLASLAMLKVNFDNGKNYIDNFLPYVAEALRCSAQREVSLFEVQAAIYDIFKLRIPLGALKTILNHAEREKLLVIEQGIYKRNDAENDDRFPQLRDEILRKYEALIRKLVGFVKASFAVDWTLDQADQAMIAFLEDRSEEVLTQMLNGQPRVANPVDEQGTIYMVICFVADIMQSDPAGFELLEAVVKGSMLANALMFPEIDAVARPFEQLEVYLDTPIVLRVIGAAGPSLQAPCIELLNLLREAQAGLRVFEHTVTEVLGVLDAAARSLRNGDAQTQGFYDVNQHFLSSNLRASDVELMVAGLNKTLGQYHIEVKQKPGYSLEYGIDEAKMGAMLGERIKYKRDEARQHDIDSLAAIHRLRDGAAAPNLEACNAIFVTTNVSLTRVSSAFFRAEYPWSVVPYCILDYTLTTIVWLKNPVKAPELPRKQLMAECYAALNPPDPLWKSYIEEIERLRAQGTITEDDYYLLRFSSEGRRALMDSTLGRPDVFAEGTVPEILERARAAARQEVEAKLAAVRDRAESLERDRRAQQEHIQALSSQVGVWCTKVVMVIVTFLIAVGVYLTLPKPVPALPGNWQAVLAPFILLLLVGIGILSILNLSVGSTVYSLIKPLEKKVAQLTQRLLTSLTGGAKSAE